jgi:hypothetical protein
VKQVLQLLEVLQLASEKSVTYSVQDRGEFFAVSFTFDGSRFWRRHHSALIRKDGVGTLDLDGVKEILTRWQETK